MPKSRETAPQMGDGSLRNTGPTVRDSNQIGTHDTQPIEKRELLSIQRNMLVEEILRRKIREIVTDQFEGGVSEKDVQTAIAHFDGHQKELLRQQILKEDRVALDLLAEKELENQRLLKKSEHDPLTSLAREELAKKIFESYKNKADFIGPDRVMVAVRFDLDGFKLINDKIGHDAGNDALKRVAAELEKVLSGIRRTDLAIRFGGDEFGLLLSGVKPKKEDGGKKLGIEETVTEIVGRYIKAIEKIILPNGRSITASAGFKIITKDDASAHDFATFYKAADEATKLAKKCKFIPAYQNGSSRVTNADEKQENFLKRKGISAAELADSAVRGALERPFSDIFPKGVPDSLKPSIEAIIMAAIAQQQEQ